MAEPKTHPKIVTSQDGTGKNVTNASKKSPLALSVSVTLLIIVAALFLMGFLRVTWKQPGQQIVLVTRVCGDAIVKQYNQVSRVRSVGGTDGLDETGLKNLVSEIKGKKNYQTDPTCQTILLAAAIHYQDYTAAKQAYDAVESLNSKHIYTDSNLSTNASLPQYEIYVQELSPQNQGSNDQEPKGGA